MPPQELPPFAREKSRIYIYISIYLYMVPYVFNFIYRGWQENYHNFW